MILFFYILFLFLILRFTVTLFNYISNPRLTGAPRTYHDLVNILVLPGAVEPARLINSLSKQEYRRYELLVLNASGSNFNPATAAGDYFLFICPSAVVKPGLINNAIHRMKMGRLSLLSLFPNFRMDRFAERLTFPLIHYILVSLLPLRLVKLFSIPAFSAASSEFMLFKASDFRGNDWLNTVFKHSPDFTRIMKQLKSTGLQAETLLANNYLSADPSADAAGDFSMLAHRPLAPFQRRASGLLVFTLLLVPGPFLVYFFLNLSLFYFYLTLIVFTRILISLSAGENILFNLVLHPIQMLALLSACLMRFVKQFRNFVLHLFRRKQPLL